ncbi:hypothetical protein ADL19_14990 [Streptomyces purpurogeneiscleroticus]|nr:hypothetical protein ADL19_14990 [Streptomyces purpurogeneiscleroticus]
MGIPPAPTKTFDHTEAFSPVAKKWLQDNRTPPMVTPTSFAERDEVERRRRNAEADRRRRRGEQRRRDDDDLVLTSAYSPAIFDHTPSKHYSSSGHDSRDHTPAHSHTTHHDTGSYSDGGSCGGDGGGCGGE